VILYALCGSKKSKSKLICTSINPLTKNKTTLTRQTAHLCALICLIWFKKNKRMPVLTDIKKITKLSPIDYSMIGEALFYLLVSDFLIYVLPMRWWSSWIGETGQANNNAPVSEQQKQKVLQVRKNVYRADKLLLKTSRCFAFSLTIKKMLNRRNINASLYLGVNKRGDGALKAHAWVKGGENIIYGGINASEKYTQLISFG
jgi:hypothetical protein